MTLQNLLGDLALDTSVQQVKTAIDAVTATINDGVPVTGSFYQATQPVSIANPVAVTGTFWQSIQPISASALPLPTGAATQTTLASVDSRLAGTLTVNTGITQPLTNAELRAVSVPVSASSLPLPTGAATSANQTTGNSSLSSIDSKLSGTITVATGLTQPLTNAELRASAVTVSAASLPLPSGAATEATLDAIKTLTAEVRNLSETILYYLTSTLEKMPRLDAADRIIVNGSEITQTVTISSGTVTTLSDQTNIGGRPASNIANAISNSGAQYLYDNILVT